MFVVVDCLLLGLVVAMGAVALPKVRKYEPRWFLYPFCLSFFWVSSSASLTFTRAGEYPVAIAYGVLALWFLSQVLRMLKSTQKLIDAELDQRNQEYDRLCEEESKAS